FFLSPAPPSPPSMPMSSPYTAQDIAYPSTPRASRKDIKPVAHMARSMASLPSEYHASSRPLPSPAASATLLGVLTSSPAAPRLIILILSSDCFWYHLA